MFSFLQCRMGISERPQSWFLQIRYKCTMLNMSCGCAGYMPGRAVRKKGRPQRPFCIPRLHPRWLGGISRWGIPFSHKQAASCGPRLPLGGRAAHHQLLDRLHSLGFSPAGMAACASEWKWICHSMWLFHPHSAVKIRPFPSAFPLAESIAKAFCWLFLEVPKE